MGLFKRLFGTHGAAPSSEVEVRELTGTVIEDGPAPDHQPGAPAEVEVRRLAGAAIADRPGSDSQPGPSAEVEVHELTGTVIEDGALPEDLLWSRPQVADYPVDWPVDAATGTVFDDTWLLDGLKRAVSPNSFRAKLEAREEKAQLRRERLYSPGVDTVQQEADMLRGRDWLEWDEHVYQMKRGGYLESALALVYEMIDVAAKSPSYDQHRVPPAWYDQAGIILRKLKRPEEEAALLRRAEADYPDSFSDQLAKAEARAAKQQATRS